jgi:hypothetical protein
MQHEHVGDIRVILDDEHAFGLIHVSFDSFDKA